MVLDIAAQIGLLLNGRSDATSNTLKPPARKTRHKMVKLKPFMDYIDMRLAENVWNSEVIFAEIKARGYTGGRSMLRYYIQPKRKMRPSKRTRRELPVKRERKAGVPDQNTTPIPVMRNGAKRTASVTKVFSGHENGK